MQNTSQKFKDAVYAPTRSVKGRVTFDISDQTANSDVSNITTTSDSPLSVKAQLINKVRSSTNKTATLEQDRFKLDGSFSFPDDTIANNGELGWSSAEIGTCDGVFENLLGTDGSCESLAPFSLNSAAPTLSTTRTRSGTYSFKLTSSNQNAYAYKDYTTTLSKSKCYLLAGWVYIESFTTGAVSLRLWEPSGFVTTRYGVSATTSIVGSWQFIYVKIPTNNSFSGAGFRLQIGNGNQSTLVGYIDEVRLYEISQDTYNKIGVDATYTGDLLVEKVPYLENPPTITFNFTSNHSSAGLTVTFDQSTGEYATDFDMTAYDSVGAVIDTVSVTGNTNIIATPLGQLYNYRKVSVTIKKWSVPYRRARVFEVDFGIVKQYTDDNLISMNLIEQMDMLSGQLPSSEFRFAVDNSDRAFNILNPSGFYKYLQQKQQIIGEIGLDIGGGVIEYVQIGNYLLQDWQSDEGSLTASFTARTNLDSMASFDYENLSASTKTLYQFAVDMFALCGITNYSIDSALSAINTNSLVKKANCRDILQMIAIAGCANIFVTRGNIITLKCNPTLIGAPIDTADFDNMYNEPQITLDKAVKRVEVTYWSNLTTSAIIGIDSTTDTLGDTLKLENNTLINNSTRATAVANWFFAQLKYRATYKVNWRGNPATELNDVLSLENSYGGNMSAYVTRNELDYVGYLKARTEAKGVVN